MLETPEIVPFEETHEPRPQQNEEEMEKPPMSTKPQTTTTNTNNANMFAPPSYRMPHGKGKKEEHPQKRPIAFTPQNVQIISGKTNENVNITETEEDKKETPRRENASNASTPTREESMKHQHPAPQTKEFTTGYSQQGKIHNLAQSKPRIGIKEIKIISDFIGRNPFAEPEDQPTTNVTVNQDENTNDAHLRASNQTKPIFETPTNSSQSKLRIGEGPQSQKDIKFDQTPTSKKAGFGIPTGLSNIYLHIPNLNRPKSNCQRS